jgi:hypothetical protein
VAVDGQPSWARPRISWGAIFAGAVAALSLWLLFYAFGLALGLSAVDPSDPHSVRGSGIFTGVWSGIAPLLALFVGGMVSARLAGVFTRTVGAMHGLVMWGLVTVTGAFLFFAAVGSLVAGAASMGRSVAQGMGGPIERMGVDWDDALAPVNERLRAEGKQAVTASQLQAAVRDSMRTSIRSRHFDRSTFEASLAQNTGLSRAEAQEISQRVGTRLDQAVESAKVGALKAADVTGKAFWGVFGALALGLLAALAGGALGITRFRAGVEPEPGRRVVRTEEPAPRGPIVPPRPAYPPT